MTGKKRVIETVAPTISVNVRDEWGVHAGENLPNHTTSLTGRGKFVRIINANPTVRTKQEAYRLAAHIIAKAQTLPDETYIQEEEEVADTFDIVLEAVLSDLGLELEELSAEIDE